MSDWLLRWLEEQIVQQWLRSLWMAGGVALAVQLLAALSGSAAARACASAAGLALGVAASYCAVAGGVPALPPAERWQWGAWLALATLLLLFFEEARGPGATLRFALHLALVAAISWWIVRPSGRARDWSPLDARVFHLAGGLALLLFLLLAEARAGRQAAWRVLLPFTLAAAGAVACFADHSDKLARASAGLFAALMVTLLLALVQPAATTLPRSAIAAATVGFASLLAYCWCARYLSDAAALLLCGAWCSALLPVQAERPGRAWLFAGGVPLAACVIAWLARAPG